MAAPSSYGDTVEGCSFLLRFIVQEKARWAKAWGYPLLTAPPSSQIKQIGPSERPIYYQGCQERGRESSLRRILQVVWTVFPWEEKGCSLPYPIDLILPAKTTSTTFMDWGLFSTSTSSSRRYYLKYHTGEKRRRRRVDNDTRLWPD